MWSTDEQSPLLSVSQDDRPLLQRRHSIQVSFAPLRTSTRDSVNRPHRYPLTPGVRAEESPDATTLSIHSDASGPRFPDRWALFQTRLRYYVPVFKWLPEYSWAWLGHDLRAGITVACLLIPQALSYGTLAKLTPIHGLYTALVPVFVYGLLGTSRHLAMGPEALLSILVGEVVDDYRHTVSKSADAPLLDPSGVARILTFLVGALTFAMGIFRLGFFDSLLSKALLRGFVTAVAFVIIIGQLIPICGLNDLAGHLPLTASSLDKLQFVLRHLGDSHILTLQVALTCIAFLVMSTLIKRRFKYVQWLQQIPEILVTVVVTTVLCYLFRWDEQGLAVFGNVEAAIPVPTLPRLPEASFYKDVLTSSLLISTIGIVESIIIAREYASKNHYSVSPNRELVALGVANLVGCVFGSYPAFGSLARSRLNDRAKARSPLAGIVSGSVVLITILVVLPAFYYLPRAVLNAIVFNTALSLLTKTPREIRFLYRLHAWQDLSLLGLIFVATMVVSIEIGIFLAVILSIVLVIKKSTVPRITILGRKSGTRDQFAPIPDSPDVVEHIEGVLMVRIEEPLSFANTGQLQARLKRLELFGDMNTHPSEDARLPPAQAVIFDVEQMPAVDASALAILKEIAVSYQSQGIQVCFVRLQPGLFLKFESSGLSEQIGHGLFFSQVADALQYVGLKRPYAYISDQPRGLDEDNVYSPL
ncbi:hypothetical protein H4R34_000432 [Dimargaris verticillata]|uniref:STAS domain-containing protein n=1 Tax=Dimargaris verticillata TaxID=2761393 RepID=A0A9W8B762_9FUNG|nr:hypothetical protein H4R34_000432 [Dimargaris verticillata]